MTTLTPDEDGGVFVELPLVDPLLRPDTLTIEARSRLTGKVITETVNPAPSVAGLWATSAAPNALEIIGNSVSTNARVHSESDLALRGRDLRLSGGTEYVRGISVVGIGASINPSAQKVPPGGTPLTRQIAEFRPGGTATLAAGSGYHAIDARECANQVWRPAVNRVLTGVVYVPCAVDIIGLNRTVGAMIAAEGPITVSGTNVRIEPGQPGQPALISGSTGADAIRIVGINARVTGTMFAPAGGVQVIGLGGSFKCGVVASTIRVVGSNSSFPFDGTCRVN